MVGTVLVETHLNLIFVLFNLAYDKKGEIQFYLIKLWNDQFYNLYDNHFLNQKSYSLRLEKSIIFLCNFYEII